MNRTYYLYRHIRHDKNEPFYIGVGTIPIIVKRNTNKYIYRRAYEKDWGVSRTNEFWVNIAKNTTYDIEILLESDNISYIYQKEAEFITLYGKICDGTGILANIDNGGTTGKGKNVYTIKKQQVPIYVYKSSGLFVQKFDSVTEAAMFSGVLTGNVCISAKNKKSVFNGYRFFYNFLGEKIDEKKYRRHGGRTVSVVDANTGEEIKAVYPAYLVRKEYGIGGDTMQLMQNEPIYKKGLIFKYKD